MGKFSSIKAKRNKPNSLREKRRNATKLFLHQQGMILTEDEVRSVNVSRR